MTRYPSTRYSSHTKVKTTLFSGSLVFSVLLLVVLTSIVEPLIFLLAYQMVFRDIWPSLPNLNFWAFFVFAWALNIFTSIFRGKR